MFSPPFPRPFAPVRLTRETVDGGRAGTGGRDFV